MSLSCSKSRSRFLMILSWFFAILDRSCAVVRFWLHNSRNSSWAEFSIKIYGSKVFRRFNDRTQAYFLKKIIEIGEESVGPYLWEVSRYRDRPDLSQRKKLKTCRIIITIVYISIIRPCMRSMRISLSSSKYTPAWIRRSFTAWSSIFGIFASVSIFSLRVSSARLIFETKTWLEESRLRFDRRVGLSSFDLSSDWLAIVLIKSWAAFSG